MWLPGVTDISKYPKLSKVTNFCSSQRDLFSRVFDIFFCNKENCFVRGRSSGMMYLIRAQNCSFLGGERRGGGGNYSFQHYKFFVSKREPYPKPCQTFNMERFVKILTAFRFLTGFWIRLWYQIYCFKFAEMTWILAEKEDRWLGARK